MIDAEDGEQDREGKAELLDEHHVLDIEGVHDAGKAGEDADVLVPDDGAGHGLEEVDGRNEDDEGEDVGYGIDGLGRHAAEAKDIVAKGDGGSAVVVEHALCCLAEADLNDGVGVCGVAHAHDAREQDEDEGADLEEYSLGGCGGLHVIGQLHSAACTIRDACRIE